MDIFNKLNKAFALGDACSLREVVEEAAGRLGNAAEMEDVMKYLASVTTKMRTKAEAVVEAMEETMANLAVLKALDQRYKELNKRLDALVKSAEEEEEEQREEETPEDEFQW